METNKPNQGRETSEQQKQPNPQQGTGTNQPTRQNTSNTPLKEEREEDSTTQRTENTEDEETETLSD